MKAYAIWIGFFLIIEAIFQTLQYPVRGSSAVGLKIVVFVVKVVLLLGVSLSITVIDARAIWHLNKVLSALHCILLGDVAASLVMGVVRLIGHQKMAASTVTLWACLAGVLVFAYATINGQVAVVRETTITSDKLERDYTFALLADTHIGTSAFYGAFEKNLDKAAALAPDFVVLAGDIVDDFATKEAMNRAFDAIGTHLVDKGIPVYYIYGNHDRQIKADRANGRQYSYEEIAAAIERNGIVAAEDAYIPIGDDLVFLGRQDQTEASRLSGEEMALRNPNREAFLLMADHSPLDIEQLEAIKPDLEVAGHTHAGQLFLTQILNLLWDSPGHGANQYGDSTVFVTAGTGGWGPVRTRRNAEIWAIHLKAS